MDHVHQIKDPAVQAIVDNPRFPTPLNWGTLAIPRSTRTGVIGNPAVTKHPTYNAPIILSGDETLCTEVEQTKLQQRQIPMRHHLSAKGAPITARPANDNEKGLSWPLYDEYVAERLGKDAYENSKNWNTAIWIDGIYRDAMLPDRALGPLHWYSDGLSYEEMEDGYSAVNAVPPQVVSVLNLLDRIERIRDKGKVGTHEASTSKDPRLPTGAEVRSDASKKLRLLQAGMRGLWKPTKQAIVEHAEMWTLGITQGVSRAMAPTAGRQRVLDGLGIAADIRHDISRWEDLDRRVKEGTCSPLGRKGANTPVKWRQAANKDCRDLRVA